MLAAVGQPRLMAVYEHYSGFADLTVAQVLLTRTDLGSRRCYLNARNTLIALLEQKVIPIVNENDTVATEEIRVGTTTTSRRWLPTCGRRLVGFATDQPGLYTADPRVDPGRDWWRKSARAGLRLSSGRQPAGPNLGWGRAAW
jgi:glutamate 5-kinase